jgi:large subunit ribosomal protein L35
MMPKMKSHSGAAKRFSKTPSDEMKSSKRKRHLRDDLLVSKADKALVKRMLPY